MDLTPEVLRDIIAKMIILVLSIAVHEFGHAFVADRLGDPLPRHEGRVTLNPIAHADPLGTLMLPLVGLLFTGGAAFGFGWGKPVHVNPIAFSRRFRMKTAHLFVAAAGPAMNILLGSLLAIVFVVMSSKGLGEPQLQEYIFYAGAVNFVLAFFNLVPAPPLDGGTVLDGLLPDRLRPGYAQYAQYGIFVVMAVVVIDKLSVIFVWPATKTYFGLLDVMGRLIG